MYPFRILTESTERNTKARQQNTESMNRLAAVVEKLYEQQVPTHINTSAGIRMNIAEGYNAEESDFIKGVREYENHEPHWATPEFLLADQDRDESD